MGALREYEHKFEVYDSFKMPDFDGVVSEGGRVSRCQPVILEDVYFDTEDLRLSLAGIIVVRSIGGADPGWVLTFPNHDPGGYRRLQLPIGDDPSRIPAEFEAALEGRTGPRHLRSFLRVRTERTVTALFDANSELVAEIADDHVLALRLADLGLSTWRAIEVGERSASPDTLERVEGLLRIHGARSAPPHPPVEIDRATNGAPSTGSAGADAVAERIRAQVGELISCENDVRARGDDGVHKMRVATRRLRSCLRTFGPAFVAETAEHLGGELKWLGGLLGAERDAEVALERIAGELDELESKQTFGAVRDSLMNRVQLTEEGAHARLIEAMDSARFRALLEELVLFAERPIDSSSLPSKTWLVRRAARTVRRTERLVARCGRRRGHARDLALHEVRKSAKHVRYAAETLVPAYGRKFDRLARAFEAVQETLGEHHDATVTRAIFRDEGSRANGGEGESGFAFGILYAKEVDRAKAAEDAFSSAWKRARNRARRMGLVR